MENINMDCKEIKEHLSAYIDDELDAELSEKVEAHLFRCFECAKLFQETGNMTLLLLQQVKTVPVPATFDRKLRIALKEERNRQTVGFDKKKLAVFSSVAAVFVIGIFSILMFNAGDGRNNAPAPNNEMPVTLAMGDYDYEEMQRTPLAEFLDFDDEDLYYEDYELLDDEDAYLEEEDEEYLLDEEEVYEETENGYEYEEQVYDAVNEVAEIEAEAEALPYGAYGEVQATEAYAYIPAPVEITFEHYLNLISDHFRGLEHRLLSYSFDEATGIYTFRVEVVVAVGVQTEVRVIRGQHGNIWPVTVE